MGRRGSIVDRGMWSLGVLVFSPPSDDRSGMIETAEQGLVQQFVAHPAIETLDKAESHMGFPGVM